MNSLEKKYLGERKEDAIFDLKSQGYEVEIIKTQGAKDIEILRDEIVISIKEKEKNKIILTTTCFNIEI